VGAVDWDQELPLDGRQRRETFARFGLAAYQAQCVERALAILLASTHNPVFLQSSAGEQDRFFDTEFAKTMGVLVRTIGERVSLAPDLESRLGRAVDLRNWLMHRYFWERAWEITDNDGRERMIAELEEAANLLGALDDELSEISAKWLDEIGVSRGTVEALVAQWMDRGSVPSFESEVQH